MSLMLDVDQAGELKAAFRRTRGSNGTEWTNEDIKRLSEGPFLGSVLDVLKGRAKIVPIKPESLLEFIGIVAIPATTEKFIARDRFVINTKSSAPVKISYLGDNFKEWLLGKVEEPISEITLRYQKLRKDSADGPIIAELGGKEKAETTLAEMFHLMERQANGEDGPLLTNGYANIFYVRDINGMLRAVSCYWDGDGWRVHAHSVEYPGRWDGGHRVFSRNSLAA